MTVELGRSKKGFHEGQKISQKFVATVGNECDAKRLGTTPLVVTGHTPGLEILVNDPLRDGYWLGPHTEFEDLADQFFSDRTDDFAIRQQFLNGDLRLRAKIWQVNETDIAFLSNKPFRRIITVRLTNKGDSIALADAEGKPYVLTR